jgi:hypothetical protein
VDEMARLENITVDILVEGNPQPIFEDPNPEDNNKEKGNNFYVEVVDDARFTVQVSLNPDFEFYHADGVRIYLSLDGREAWAHYLRRNSLEVLHSKTITTHPNYNATTRQWQDEAFSFGKLRICKQWEFLANDMLTRLYAVESTHLEEAPNTLQRLGQISVEIKRVTRHLRSKPKPVKALDEKTVTQVSEKLLKGKAIENAIRSGLQHILSCHATERCARPISTGFREAPIRTYKYQLLAGDKGIPVKFNILYRSRSKLGRENPLRIQAKSFQKLCKA